MHPKLNPFGMAIPKKVATILFVIIAAIGSFLRLYQYFMGRSIWEDEAHLALNIINRNLVQLLEPLDHLQMAPVLFVLLTKTITLIFGENDLAFRLLPLALSVITLPLFYFISYEITKNRVTSLIAFAVFSINLTPCYFATELKPYAIDLSVYLLIIFIAITSFKGIANKRILLLSLVGVISIFLSFTSIIVLACVGLHFVFQWYQEKKVNTAYIKVFAFWGIAFLVNYFLFMHNNPNSQGMQKYWGDSFMPLTFFSTEFFQFVKVQYDEVFFSLLLNLPETYGLFYILPFILLFTTVYAFIKKNYGLLLFAFLPIFLNLILSAFHFYPFYYRLILYLMPAFVLIIAVGISKAAYFIGKKTHFSIYYILVVLCSVFLVFKSVKNFPLWFRDIGPSIHFIETKYPDAAVYITTPINTYTYYDKIGKIKSKKFEPISWNMSPENFETRTLDENRPFVLLVNSYHYKHIINYLKSTNRIIDQQYYKDYGVWVINPSPNSLPSKYIKIDYSDFNSSHAFVMDFKKMLAIWSGNIKSNPIKLNKGKYKMIVESKGTPAFEKFPHINVFINKESIGSFTNQALIQNHEFTIEIKEDNPVLHFEMDNDTVDASTGADRNSFISRILFEKIE